MNIQNGETIVDIGSGDGLLVYELSKLTDPDGIVIAAIVVSTKNASYTFCQVFNDHIYGVRGFRSGFIF